MVAGKQKRDVNPPGPLGAPAAAAAVPNAASPAATRDGQPRAPSLTCLRGLRAVASIGVVCLHTFMFWQFFLPHKVKFNLTRGSALIRLASAGMLWVDVLLILSALLAAYQLLPLLEDLKPGAPSCRAVVLRYWRGRAARILPGYLAANLLAALALGPVEGVPREAQAARWINFYFCPGTLWANLLFIQNWRFMGGRACAIHLWTVALQAQFFLAFPLLLCALRPRSPGFRARLVAALVAVFVGGSAWRLWAARQIDFLELPVADFAVDAESQRSWANMIQATYLPTASRAAELAGGAALGLLLRSPAALEWLRRRRILLAATALGLQASYAGLLQHRHLLFRAPGEAPWPLQEAQQHIAVWSYGGPFVTALVGASLLALILRADPLHALAARLLGMPWWRPLAELSFPLYLLHEQARLWALLLLLPRGLVPSLIQARPLLAFAGVCGGTLAVGYVAALLLHLALPKRWSQQRSELAPAGF